MRVHRCVAAVASVVVSSPPLPESASSLSATASELLGVASVDCASAKNLGRTICPIDDPTGTPKGDQTRAITSILNRWLGRLPKRQGDDARCDYRGAGAGQARA